MSYFASQLVSIKRSLILNQSLNYEPEDFLENTQKTSNLMLEAYSLSFDDVYKTEKRLYEIYYALSKRFPRFVVEVRHPVLFRSKLKCIKYEKFLWSLLSYED